MQRFRRRDKVVAALVGICVIAVVVLVRWPSDTSTVLPSNETEQHVSDQSENPFRTGRTLVIPHGGGDGLFPENTLLAFEQTMAMGADMVDVDLRLSEDDVVVAFHDATVDRITGATGSVRTMTFEQLSGLDAGWSFTTAGSDPTSDDAHQYRSKGVTIPSFESVLDEFPTTLLSVDLKDETLAMVEPVCDALVEHQRFDDVFVGSNNDEQILEFRRLCPAVRTSAIMADVYASRAARADNDPKFVPAVTVNQPPFRREGRQLVDAESLAWAHQHGVAVLTWVVNDVDDMKLLVELGVDGIYTSYPDRLLEILGRCTAGC